MFLGFWRRSLGQRLELKALTGTLQQSGGVWNYRVLLDFWNLIHFSFFLSHIKNAEILKYIPEHAGGRERERAVSFWCKTV